MMAIRQGRAGFPVELPALQRKRLSSKRVKEEKRVVL
jgi:hypothetical protein